MATLSQRTPRLTFKDLLQVSNDNKGIDGELRRVRDGEDTQSALSLSETSGKINGTFNVTGNLTSLNSSNWDTAFSWGNHALAGYKTQAQATADAEATALLIASVLTLDQNEYIKWDGILNNANYSYGITYNSALGFKFMDIINTEEIFRINKTGIIKLKTQVGATPTIAANDGDLAFHSTGLYLGN